MINRIQTHAIVSVGWFEILQVIVTMQFPAGAYANGNCFFNTIHEHSTKQVTQNQSLSEHYLNTF